MVQYPDRVKVTRDKLYGGTRDGRNPFICRDCANAGTLCRAPNAILYNLVQTGDWIEFSSNSELNNWSPNAYVDYCSTCIKHMTKGAGT